MLTFDASRVGNALNSASVTQTQPPPTSSIEDKPAAPAVTYPDTRESVSSLAQQLSNAAARAEAQNAGLDFAGLAEKAKRVNEQLLRASNKALQDAEIPNTDDPQLLDRARKATDFENGIGRNPFKGLSREQLSLITNDESGSFTINERRAAWSEAHDQEEAWRRKVFQAADEEFHTTGKQTVFFSELLAHYQSLPALEKAQYPENYASTLQQRIRFESAEQASYTKDDKDNLFSKIEDFFEDGSLTGQANQIDTEPTKAPSNKKSADTPPTD
ncbi:hypothetical protein DCO48_08540 [Pseudomonas sp. SDI]|uniref:hypothetical protein n=1 Tax=Pseudomonas sp. SDI TaxID=2170734 RepID=UPI000DE609FF|nr:hypothetical protein [Pseudomonas sp. SDI]PWB33695.1 hypothetical protein DCO48_08540 [Pseudomonas sp. SDI]